MKKSEKLHKNVMNTAKCSFFLKPDVISFKKSLIWDQSQHSSSSKRLKVTEVWNETPPFMSERKSWNASNDVTLKNDVEAKPVEKSAEILHEKTAVNMLSDRKNPNSEIWIVFTQYIFCWYQLLLKTGYF